MGRPRACSCDCGPPDCFGCNPVKDVTHLPLAFVMDWTGPTWGMPISQVDTISGLQFSFPIGYPESGAQQWNCGSWYPPPTPPGICNTPVTAISLETRWDTVDPSLIGGTQYLCKQGYNEYTYTSPNPCNWSHGRGATIIQYSHNGYLARGSAGGAPISGPSAWTTEIRANVEQAGNPLAGLGCKNYVWDGGDSGAGLYNGASSPRLWTLNTARPTDNGYMGWVRSQSVFGHGLSLSTALRDGSYYWYLTAVLGGARSWRTQGTRLTGPYVGHHTGSTYGSNASLVEHGAVSTTSGKIHLGGWTLNWMNDYFSVHPTYEMALGIQCTPSSIPPGAVRLGPPGTSVRYNLVSSDATTYLSDDPIDCIGDLDNGDEITFSLDTAANAVDLRTRNGITFGTTWPATITGSFIPNP